MLVLPFAGEGAAWGQGVVSGGVRGAGWRGGVVVRVVATETGAQRTTRSLADGSFQFAGLEPGRYQVVVTGGAGREISVVAGEVLELRPGAGGAVVEAPSLHGDEEVAPDEDADGLASVHGLASTSNREAAGGVESGQSYSGEPVGTAAERGDEADGPGDAAGLGRGRPSGGASAYFAGSVREFRVAGPGYSALMGGAGVARMTVLRGGGERWRGEVTYEVQSSAWAAANPLAVATSYADGVVTSGVVKPHDLRQVFGAGVGGPVPYFANVRWYGAYQGERRDLPAVSSPGYAGFYSLTATQSALLATRGVSVAATNAALDYLSGLTGPVARSVEEDAGYMRLDWRDVSASWSRSRRSGQAGLAGAPVVARGRASFGDARVSLDTVVLGWAKRLGLGWANDARVQYLRDLQYELAQAPLAQEPAIGPGGLVPEVNIGPNGLLFGTPASASKAAYPYERRWQLVDVATWVRGHHAVQVGLDASALVDATNASPNPAGTFTYDSGLVGGKAGGLVDWITDYTFNVSAYPNGGCPSINVQPHYFCFRSFAQSFGPQSVSFATQEWAGFVQERWQVRAGLTVTAGMRYEYQLLPVPQQPNAALDAVFGATGATSSFPEDRNNLGPRVGVAYQPWFARRVTVRAGYGAYYGRLPGATIAAALSDTGLAGANARIRILPTTTTACPQGVNQGFGYPCAYVTAPPAAIATTTSVVVFDRRFRLPEVQQGSVTVERAVGRRGVVSVGYTFNLDRQLQGSSDLNITASPAYGLFQLIGGTGAPGVRDGETFVVPLYTSRVSTSFGPVTDVRSNGNGSYNGLTAVYEGRVVKSLNLRASYMWSKALDYGQSLGGVPRTASQFDPFTVGYDKGRSALDYPQSFVVRGAWEPVGWARSQRLKAVTGGWLVAPVLVARSGRPYSLQVFGGARLSGGHESLNGSGGAVYLPTVGRDTARLPAEVTLNVRVSRDLPIPVLRRDHLRLRGYAEAYNLANHVHVTGVNQRAYVVCTSTNAACPAAVAGVTTLLFQNATNIAAEGLNAQPFGTPTTAGSETARERRVQVGLRLEF